MKQFYYLSIAVFCFLSSNLLKANDKTPLRIMPLGDSITAGYTDNPKWTHPFEFGYRSGLYRRLTTAGYNFVFVGESKEPFDMLFGDPTHAGTVTPKFDLRTFNQDHHRGYGGRSIDWIKENIATWIYQDRPDIILLLIGINGMNADSPRHLDSLVETIFTAKKDVTLIVAQIPPRSNFSEDVFNYNVYIKDILIPAYIKRGYRIKTVDLYRLFLTNSNNPKSIDKARFANGINHPLDRLYDQMAESWFTGIKTLSITKKKQVEQGAAATP